MNQDFGVFVTDGVNRNKEWLPLSALVESVENHVRVCAEDGAPIGLPFNVSHDKCRPIGWTRATGVHLAKDLGRQLGVIFRPVDEAEQRQISDLVARFNNACEVRGVEPHVDELRARVGDQDVGFGLVEAAAAGRRGLAASLYPDLFDPALGHVDKDGLVDYAALLARTTRLQPGVFHDPRRDLVLFAHPFFRRSLSHLNSLNGYVLDSFHRIATTTPELSARIRLDPDLVGHPKSARAIVELEYWRGPRFDDDVAAIPSGVAEYRSTEDQRFYSAVDKTQIWWKPAETRRDDVRGVHQVRTFEVEELVEDPSPGLGRNRFGCRYAHAEYDLEHGRVSHFDGAIRGYEADPYLARLDLAIDRAGKQADYTKLFRLDGPLPTADWKRLLCDFYRGNHLIPEYLGAPQETTEEQAADDGAPTRVPALSALLNFDVAEAEATPVGPSVIADQSHILGEVEAPFAEVGRGALAALMRRWADEDAVSTGGFEDRLVNLAMVDLGARAGLAERWRDVAGRLLAALEAEVAEDRVERLSLAVRWTRDRVVTTLSLAGEAPRVLALLCAAREIVQPDQSAETWAEALHAALREHAPDLDGRVDWPRSAVVRGRLSLARTEDVEIALKLPESLMPIARALCAKATSKA